ncbi:MAG: hypothetical protein PWP65_962 [Clostridia bacterium]|nr:hypothetical protein [Clostridia bacterium]
MPRVRRPWHTCGSLVEMARSVIISKIAYYMPGDKTRANNARHIQYIALKPEADRGDEQAYRVGDEDYRPELGTAAGHVEYAAERPGSSGLFGPDDPSPDWREVAKELSHHDLPTWRVIVSLREDDAVRLGLTDRAAWEPAIRAAAENAIKTMHLDPDHARWVAAFHQKQGHPHVHLVIWEMPHDAARRRGLLEDGERKAVWRAFARELFRDERNRLAAEKSAIRDAVRELAKGDTTKAQEILKQIRGTAPLEVRALDGATPGIMPVLGEEKEAELARRLVDLAAVMPGGGRVALAYMPEPVKAQAREVADWLLNQPGFQASVEKYVQLAKELASYYTQKPQALQEAEQKAYSDLRDRVAQLALKGAVAINHLDLEMKLKKRQEARQVEVEKGRIANSVWKAAWRAIERERTRAEAQAELAKAREIERRTEKRETNRR